MGASGDHKPHTIEAFAAHLKAGPASSILVLTGAGFSTSAGIPDFRSPKTGLYDNLSHYNIPTPESIFDIRYFRTNPEPFFHLAKELFPGKFSPTVGHAFNRLLHEKGLLRRSYTQNIDALEHLAGVPEEKLVEAHGSFFLSTCTSCGERHKTTDVFDPGSKGVHIPLCAKKKCLSRRAASRQGPGEAVLKPNIVFFGEQLPKRFFKCLQRDFPLCDAMIIMGTSLAVQPFASLIDMVPAGTPRLLINMERVGSLDLTSPSSKDAFYEGSCDDGVRRLADLMGWLSELDELYGQVQGRNAKAEQVDISAAPAIREDLKSDSTSDHEDSRGARATASEKEPSDAVTKNKESPAPESPCQGDDEGGELPCSRTAVELTQDDLVKDMRDLRLLSCRF